MSKQKQLNKYMSAVKVGPKGQIVIPKEARDMFNIQSGDTLLLLADKNRGIAVQRLEYFDALADEIFLKATNNTVTSKEKEDGLRFADKIKIVKECTGKEEGT